MCTLFSHAPLLFCLVQKKAPGQLVGSCTWPRTPFPHVKVLGQLSVWGVSRMFLYFLEVGGVREVCDAGEG